MNIKESLFPLSTVGSALLISTTRLCGYFHNAHRYVLIGNALFVGFLPAFLRSPSFATKMKAIAGGAIASLALGYCLQGRVTYKGVAQCALLQCALACIPWTYAQKPRREDDVPDAEIPLRIPQELAPVTRDPRSSLEKVRDDNLSFMEVQQYQTTQGSIRPLKTKETLHATSTRYELREAPLALRGNRKTEIQVMESDCLDAAESNVLRGYGYRTAVVCFASTREPGGAFGEGQVGTQEEDICYRSTLGGFMQYQIDVFSQDFYPLATIVNEANPASDIPAYAIHTPGVQVFRDRSYQLMQHPFEIGVISIPALVRPTLTEEGRYQEQDRDKMRALIRTQLLIAHEQGYNALVLGAFGCGAFQNPPREVAELYRAVLAEEFPGIFDRIVFAILGDQRSRAIFQRTLI